MKKLNFSLYLTVIIMFTVFTVNSGIQIKQEDKSKPNKVHINKKGEVFDHGWNKLGYIDKDNIARNLKGQKVYFIDRNGNVFDANGKNLGKAAKNGNFYNIKGENIITVRDKDQEICEILDPKGHSMGTVHKNYKLHSCAAHCYFLKQEKVNPKK